MSSRCYLKRGHYTEFLSKNLLACLQADTSSFRLFNVPRYGLWMMKYFSHRHRLHLLEAELYDLACFKVFHEISYFSLWSFSSHMYLLSSVLRRLLQYLKVDLWLAHLVLKVSPV